MKYSRFDENLGIYDVYEDGRPHALNSDLPVPSLPPPTNNIGVAAKNAGRPLPGNARHVGKSWHAVGVLVPSEAIPGALSGAVDDSMRAHPVIWTLGAVAGGYLAWRVYRGYR